MKKILFLLIGIFALFFSGCNQNRVVIENEFPDYISIDSAIADKFIFVSKADGISPSGNKKVMIEMENGTNLKQTIMYKAEWKNKQGFVEKTIMSRWIMIDVQPQRKFQIVATAPTKYATSYNIRIVKPNSDDYNRKNSYQSDMHDR